MVQGKEEQDEGAGSRVQGAGCRGQGGPLLSHGHGQQPLMPHGGALEENVFLGAAKMMGYTCVKPEQSRKGQFKFWGPLLVH